MNETARRGVQRAYLLAAFVVFLGTMFLVFPFMALTRLIPYRRFREYLFLILMKCWAASFFLFGVRFRSRSPYPDETAQLPGPFILVANHNSLVDTPALYFHLSRFARPLAKIELTRPPVFGWICRWITLPVDRNRPESRRQAMEKMDDYLAGGGSLLIFPEGRTERSGQGPGPFETGAFSLSIRHNIPIVPVFISNSRHCLAPGKPMILKPGRVELKPGPVFMPLPEEDPRAFAARVREWFTRMYLAGLPAHSQAG